MDGLKKTLGKIEDRVIDLCSIFLALITLTIIYQVVVRRIGIATSGTEELARYSYVLFVFMIWPVAAKRGDDLRITVLFDLLSQRVRSILMGVFQIFMAIYSAVCIYSIYLNIQNAVKNGTVLPSNTWVPMWVVYVIILVALVLTLVANLLRAYFLFTGSEVVKTQDEINEEEMAAESAKVQKMLEKEKLREQKEKGVKGV